MNVDDNIERHRFGYRWRQRFPDARVVTEFEGGANYLADAEGSYWLITDAGTLADFLPGDDPGLDELVTITRFSSRADRDELVSTLRTQWKEAHMDARGLPDISAAEQVLLRAADLCSVKLEERARDEGLGWINERDHLQPEYSAAVDRVANAVEHGRSPSGLRHELGDKWPKLGSFDITLAIGSLHFAVELKCGSDAGTLSACAWDAAKLAFCLQHGVGNGAYLVAAAPDPLWTRDASGLEFFRSGAWDMADIRTRYASSFRKWEKDGYIPLQVVRHFASVHVGRSIGFKVADQPWTIGVARIDAEDSELMAWESLATT